MQNYARCKKKKKKKKKKTLCQEIGTSLHFYSQTETRSEAIN